ncbi:transcriptional regulator [Actinocatenispora thailandica]|uniref:Transcriptional regulator n=1 Tax=Actinocatenispora thailandica TaxID=227318 RepID=A0A7R7DLB5_9ACTN|nr:helix-turn-helix domain-containing protein [Actinocatenispora thailandica]BCJ33702.1 transcriptional regulator [Actinocatenispora thailandica]
MYRIHFTAHDLARTRVSAEPLPLLELQLAVRAVQDRSQPVRFAAWRRHCAVRLPEPARMALSLSPPNAVAPTFCWPGLPGTPEQLLEQARTIPDATVARELADITCHDPVPRWAAGLGHDAELRASLHAGVEQLFDRLLAPYWPRLADTYAADRAVRLRQFQAGGVAAVLAAASPEWLRWRSPVLEIRMPTGLDHDLYLAGQGVLLAPSAFASRAFVSAEGDQQPVVAYPVDAAAGLPWLTALTPAAAAGPAVAALLGRTRATVLTAIAEHPECSTTELARLADISPAGASQHATVLRAAGLVRTVRHRNAALHVPTQLGLSLLAAPAT